MGIGFILQQTKVALHMINHSSPPGPVCESKTSEVRIIPPAISQPSTPRNIAKLFIQSIQSLVSIIEYNYL
jgi:hypothetical protein